MCGERDGRVWKSVGEGVERCVGVDGMSGKMWGRCGKVRWGVGKGRCGGRCREVLEKMWRSVLGCGGRCGKVLGKVWEGGEMLGEMWESVLGCGQMYGEMWGEV